MCVHVIWRIWLTSLSVNLHCNSLSFQVSRRPRAPVRMRRRYQTNATRVAKVRCIWLTSQFRCVRWRRRSLLLNSYQTTSFIVFPFEMVFRKLFGARRSKSDKSSRVKDTAESVPNSPDNEPLKTAKSKNQRVGWRLFTNAVKSVLRSATIVKRKRKRKVHPQTEVRGVRAKSRPIYLISSNWCL